MHIQIIDGGLWAVARPIPVHTTKRILSTPHAETAH